MTLDKADRQTLATMIGGLAYLCYAISPLPFDYAVWLLTTCVNTCLVGQFFALWTLPISAGGILVGIIFSIIAWILGSRDRLLFIVPLSTIIAAIALYFGPSQFVNELTLWLVAIWPTLFVAVILGWRMLLAILRVLIQPKAPTLPPERYLPNMPPPERT